MTCTLNGTTWSSRFSLKLTRVVRTVCKLHLVDIDLRWGVKDEDTQNRNVVGVCLRLIDEARPFFLCFLGQRRGWVPGQEDISPSTMAQNAFPDLKNAIGNTSVTEMEDPACTGQSLSQAQE